MKHLPIYDKGNREALEGFSRWLGILGHHRTTLEMLPSCAREFLHHMERQGEKGIKGIALYHVQGHLSYLENRPNQRQKGGLSNSMLNHHVYAIRKFFHYLEQMGHISGSPVNGLRWGPLKPPARETLTREEVRLLYGACETLKDRAILALFYGCGLRRAEAERLDIRGLRLKARALHVEKGKGGKSRQVPISKRAAEDLKNYLYGERPPEIRRHSPPDAPVLNKKGYRMSGASYNQRLKELVQKTGDKTLILKTVSLHTLRHSIATHLLANGLPVESVRDFLGHRHLESTQHYTRVNIGQLRG